jgi:hypothetical protein
MEHYALDLAPELLVRWLRHDLRSGHARVLVRAWREYQTDDSDLTQAPLGDEADDVHAVSAIGTLELEPEGRADGWVLTVRVEDTAGPRLPEDEDAPAEPEALDLEAFVEAFPQLESGGAFMWVSVESPAAKRSFEGFLERMVKRHRGGRQVALTRTEPEGTRPA